MNEKKDKKAAGKGGAKDAAKEPATGKVAKGRVTHVAIVLDRSGSMEAVRDETISGFNEQVGKIRAKAAQSDAEKTFVTLVLFNDEVVFSKFAEPAEALAPIDRESYEPDRTTAMLDAVGFTLERFQDVVRDDDDTRYLVVVISDGAENDSHEYTYERIAEMIQKRQATGRWTFSYMGANQDLSVISERLSIPRSNLGTYVSSPGGTMIGFGSLSRSVIGFMSKPADEPLSSDKFFRDEDEIRSVEDDDDPDAKPN